MKRVLGLPALIPGLPVSIPGLPVLIPRLPVSIPRLPVSIPRPVSLPESPLRLLQARAQRQILEDVLLASGVSAIVCAPIPSTIASLASASSQMTPPLSGLARDVESERRLLRAGTLLCQANVAFQRLASEGFRDPRAALQRLPAVPEQVAVDYAVHGRQRTASHRQA